MHQPQPPGYPLFVLLLKTLDLILHDARLDLLVAGLIGSIAAVGLLWGLARAMFGEPAGYISALVLAVHPLFWYAGLANPVRIHLALISISTVWAGWRCLSTQSSKIWLLVMGATLGVLSGFRPETLLLLAPLFVAVGLRARVTWLGFVMAVLLMVARAGSWIAVLTYKAGGFQPFLELYFGYLGANSQDYTLMFGAPQRRRSRLCAGPSFGTSYLRSRGRGRSFSRGRDSRPQLRRVAACCWHVGFCRRFYSTHSCMCGIWIKRS